MKFNIHDKVFVNLDEAVSKKIKEQICFQIKYFETSRDIPKGIKEINIFNYSKFLDKGAKFSTIFHLNFGSNKGFHNPNKKLAVEKNQKGFNIYIGDYGFIVNQYIQLLLLEVGITFVHAGGVVNSNNNVILFPGPGGVGKTAILNHFIEKRNFKVLGDDLIGIDRQGICYSFPREFVLKRVVEPPYMSSRM